MRSISTAQLGVDVAAVAAMSVAIAFVSDRPGVMWTVLGVVLVLRFVAWAQLHRERSIAAELVFFTLCTVVGAFNDWNTVVVHEVYTYAVPAELPAVSSIPIWMLVYWGVILRLVFALTRWQKLAPPEAPSDRVGNRRSVALKLLCIGAVTLSTRLAIYAFFESALWSWLPFAIGLGLYALVTRAGAHDLRLAAIAVVVGPLAEIFYIQVGSLHAYGLGWFGGVPLWIVLWWVLSVWIWKDLGMRAHTVIEHVFAVREPQSASTQKRWIS